MKLIGQTNIEPLIRALDQFERFRQNNNSDQEKAGTIQAFEYCFELTWKIMKRLLAEQGHMAHSPREVFRLAALEGWITDPELWFDFLKKRNVTVHTYNPAQADEVIAVCPIFSEAIQSFLQYIQRD